MKTYTIAPPHARINQSIRDVLSLDVAATHGHWIIAADSINAAVHLMRARGFPGWPITGDGLIKDRSEAPGILAAAGLLDQPGVFARTRFWMGSSTVAVVDKGGKAHRIGVISDGRFTPDGDHLTGPERAAMDVWLRGSADTTGMLYAVRAALAAAGRAAVAPDARDRLARHLFLHDAGGDTHNTAYWDQASTHLRARYERRADQILNVITGQEN